jgi:cell division septation protein DedD
MLGMLPFREVEPAAAEPKREPAREAIHEAVREIGPPQSAPHSAALPSTAVHSGWIIQVGAFDTEQDGRNRTAQNLCSFCCVFNW